MCYDNLIKNIKSVNNNFTENEIESILKISQIQTYKKREYLVKSSTVNRNIFYINKGLFKTYMTNAKGESHIIFIGKEDFWATDLTSYVTGKESLTTIECIEDCEVIKFDYFEIEKLFLEMPKFESNFRKMLQLRMLVLYKDRFNLISKSAEERYSDFIRNNFELVQRVTQKDIASYLGIFPESLSRIRRQLLVKK